MKIWFTSDTDFGHKNIIKYCNRPFETVEEMDSKLIKNWNKLVKPKDTVFHLGDFAFRDHINYLEQLNGQMILIKGNHDHKTPGLLTILEKAYIDYGGYPFELIHNPWNSEFVYVICGHVHEKWKSKIFQNKFLINVGVDQNCFKPVSIDEILLELYLLERRSRLKS